jgi:hypothetical protein
LVYEFARRKVRRNLFQQFEDGDWSGIQEQMQVLETAIDKLESAHKAPALTFGPEPPLTYQQLTTDIAGENPISPNTVTLRGRGGRAPLFNSPPYEVDNAPSPETIYDYDSNRYFANRGLRKWRFTFWWKVQLSVAALLGVVVFAAINGQSALRLFGLQRLEATTKAATGNAENAGANILSEGKAGAGKDVRPTLPGMPIPSEYGAYALSNGNLVELGLLPLRVPDPRIAISAAIPTPSQAHLAAGKLEFVIFRRDLASNAPDRVAVRVVAQVVRALTFNGGAKATITNVAGSWIVRGNSYQMRVAPVPDNPEMILIRPDPPDLVFPAGRYALVIKNVAYDFTLDGPLTDTAHCLERTDALSGPVYTECRKL